VKNIIWANIAGYEGVYQINIHGTVRSLDRTIKHKNGNYHKVKGGILRHSINRKTGYKTVSLYKNSRQKRYDVHRLLANCFIENPYSKKEVNHMDGNKLNNDLSNLEWCTRSENASHAHKSGLINNWHPLGEMNPNSKLTTEKASLIKRNYVKGSRENGLKALSERFGVSVSTISRTVRGESFKGVAK
jgi:hypothetical protein